MMTCFTHSGKTIEEKSNLGLVSGHAYTILDVRNILDINGNPQRLLKVRNPWGKFEWKGAFSDTSQLWSQDNIRDLEVR